MTRRIIDISTPLQNDVEVDPPMMRPRITYLEHRQTIAQILPFFPGLKAEDLPDGEGWAIEMVQLTTHNGTHLDAPWHYHSTMNDGERASTIDEIPLDWCFQRGVKLDFRDCPDGYVVTAADVEAELKRIGHELQPLDIVLVNTSAGSRYGKPDYLASGCGMGARRHAPPAPAGRARDRNRRLELGRPVCSYRAALRRDARPVDRLGRPQGWTPARLLPPGKARESRGVAVGRVHGVLLPGEDRTRLGRLDAGSGDHRIVKTCGELRS